MARKKKTSKTQNPQEKEANARRQALELTIEHITKRCGTGSIMVLGKDYHSDVPAISTGSLSLDMAIGVGGIPRGRITEIYGPESSGKTTLALTVAANAQKQGGVVAFVDAEHALDPTYARKIGVNLDALLVSQPDSGEQALEIVELLVQSNAVDVIVVDSVAALVPKAELEGNMGDTHVGLQARLMSQAMRKLTGTVHRTRTALIFINQLREKIGVMFGSPETTSGGRALKFYSSVRLDIRRIAQVKGSDGVTIASRCRVKVVKNKVAPPFRKAEFDIVYAKGISWFGDVLDQAVDQNIVRKAGSWYSFGETRIGQGRERTIEFLENNPDIAAEVEHQLLTKLFPPQEAEEPADEPVAVG
jgi:recombination protein RecA